VYIVCNYVKFGLLPRAIVANCSSTKESGLNNVFRLRGRSDFNPEDLQELGVAFENCCAAMPESKSQEFREQLALRLINWATIESVDGTELYIRALHTYRALERL
jgi:hypothetical protein